MFCVCNTRRRLILFLREKMFAKVELIARYTGVTKACGIFIGLNKNVCMYMHALKIEDDLNNRKNAL